MNKTNQFSPKEQYVTPSCRMVQLGASDALLSASFTGGNDSLENMTLRDEVFSWDNEA